MKFLLCLMICLFSALAYSGETFSQKGSGTAGDRDGGIRKAFEAATYWAKQHCKPLSAAGEEKPISCEDDSHSYSVQGQSETCYFAFQCY